MESLLSPGSATASSSSGSRLEDNLGSSSVALMILFGATTFATVGMTTKTWLLQDYRAMNAATGLTKQQQLQPYRRVDPLDFSFVSIYVFLYHASILGLILFFTFIMEQYPPFPPDDRTAFDSDLMIFVLLLILVIAWKTVERNDGKALPKHASAFVRGRKKAGAVSFHEDAATVTSASAASRTSRLSGADASVASSKSGASGASAASSTGSAEIMDLQQLDDVDHGYTNNNHHQSMLHHRNSGGSGGCGGSDLRSIKSEEHKSMLAAHGIPQSFDDATTPVGSDGSDATSPVGSVHGGKSISSDLQPSVQPSIHSMDKKLEDILLDDATVNNPSNTPPKIVQKRRLTAMEPANDVLNYSQSLEWRGWMSTAFLVYQVCNAGSLVFSNEEGEDAYGDGLRVNIFYNIARLGATCFIFITGFNHTFYFYAKQDYSIVRVLRILLRINLTVLFLCLMLGNRYILYKICPLHSYAFLLIYATMCVKRGVNYNKFGLRMKIVGLGFFIYLVWDADMGLFGLIHGIFFATGPKNIVGAPYGPLWEFYYRSHLHHWTVLIGMCFAVNHPILSLLLRKLEALSSWTEWTSKGVTAIALATAFSIWILGPLQTNKYAFNATHPYFAFIPILFYLYLRNINATLREHGLGLFKSLGRHSLEIYLLHHHLLLTDDGGSILVLIPGYPKCNAMLLGLILIQIAKLLKTVTDILIAMLLPTGDEAKSVMNVVLLGGSILIAHGIALFLRATGMLSLQVVATAIVVFGVLIYQAVIDMTWKSYRRGKAINAKIRVSESLTTKASPLIIGTLVVFFLGITLNVASLTGATSAFVPLLSSCDSIVNDGLWINIGTCSSLARGLFTREYGVGGMHESIPACSEENIQQWAWEDSSDSTECHFRHRTTDQLQRDLAGKKIAFVGDTMVKAMFHSLCRALGDLSYGAFDAITPAHSDDKAKVADTTLEFRWAPLAVDEEKKLREYRIESSVNGKVDLIIVVGGGSWDRLHVYATDEDQESHKQAVKKLANELDELRAESIPTIWLTPTTVNTEALLNEEKRSQMSEEGMQEMRKTYTELGVESAAAFVLDGPSFTSDRTKESYDGIHYPHSVYDAGTQILVNALDWLLDRNGINIATQINDEPPPLGSMGNPTLGIMIFCFVLIGLFFFDALLGFSYLSPAFIRIDTMMPSDLYLEAFRSIHQRFRITGSTNGTKKSKLSDASLMMTAESMSLIGSVTTDQSSMSGGTSSSGKRSFLRRKGDSIEMT